ncbi:MAG: hypothetical protein GXO30_05645 [Epsilonproteobacteria bacterium]|nr:hypothetical protein [Campylobacterota bacterium]
MDITLIIKSVMGLVVILGVLMFLLLYKPKDKKVKVTKKIDKKVTKKVQPNNKLDLESLRAIIKNKNTTTKELGDAVDAVLKDYGVITKKMGMRLHPDYDIYREMLFMVSKHKNADKNIILKFNKELERLNPQYKREINDAMSRGLNARV